MRSWATYLRLQGELAYSNRVARDWVEPPRVGHGGTLVIGPGGPNEIHALNGLMPRPFVALTLHEPEADAVSRAWPDMTVCVGDIHDLPAKTASFDAVYANNVLEHVFAPYCALMECRRVVRSGGLGVFVMPFFGGSEGGRGPFHLHCLTPEVWGELLCKTGWQLSEASNEPGGEDPSGGYHSFRCRAVTPPWPHYEILMDLIADQGTR